MEKNIIIEELYAYFTNQGYSFGCEEFRWMRTHVAMTKEKLKNTISCSALVERLDNKKDKNSRLEITGFTDNLRAEFFKHLCQKYPQNNLYNQLGYLHPNWCTFFELYLDTIYELEAEPLKRIKSIRVSLWSLSYDSRLEKLDKYLSSKHSEAEVYNFYKGFFPQFEKNTANLQISRFLLRKYNYEEKKLAHFSKHFNEIRNNFTQHSFNFFTQTYPHIKSFSVDESQISKELQISFNVSKFFTLHYEVLKKEKLFEKFKYVADNKIKNGGEYIFYSHKEIDLEAIVAESKNILNFIYENRMDLNPKLMETWYEKRALDNSLLGERVNTTKVINKL